MQQFDQLAQAVQAEGYSAAGFESLVLNLSPQQERLYGFLRDRDCANTAEVRQACSIGNVSECARSLNLRLAAAGDPQRVICEQRQHTNRFGERGQLGYWRLVGSGNDRGGRCE